MTSDAGAQPTGRRFYLVRHGESTWNAVGRIQGRQDPALSDLGRRQAAALGRSLRPVALDSVYTSPQQRARLTAQAVVEHRQLSVTVDPDLAEIDHGAWEGLTEAEVARRFAASYATWLSRPAATQMPQGEHFAALRDRVRSAWQRILAEDPGRRILVVSHDLPLKVIIADVLGLDLNHVGRLAIANGAISVVDECDGQTFVVQLNDRCHLCIAD